MNKLRSYLNDMDHKDMNVWLRESVKRINSYYLYQAPFFVKALIIRTSKVNVLNLKQLYVGSLLGKFLRKHVSKDQIYLKKNTEEVCEWR